MDFGSFTNTFVGRTQNGFSFNPIMLSTHVTDNIARVGFNYHFY